MTPANSVRPPEAAQPATYTGTRGFFISKANYTSPWDSLNHFEVPNTTLCNLYFNTNFYQAFDFLN